MIHGRLENLINQTLFKKGLLEIIVIDSGSPENEKAISAEFITKYSDRIIYLRTDERETIYKAWNRGIAIARGEYITNQNTDDRMKSNAIERLSNYLDEHSECVLVHADQQVVLRGESFDVENLNGKANWQWGEFSRLELLFSTQVGSQPLWRKSLHEKYGYFDESLQVLGDRDFYVRISGAGNFYFISEILGSLDISPSSITHTNLERNTQEMIRIFRKYTSRENIAYLFDNSLYGAVLNDEQYQILVNNVCCELAEKILPRFNFPFYIFQVFELLNSVADIASYNAIIKINIVRILRKFANDQIFRQFTGQWDKGMFEFYINKIMLEGESLERI